MSEKNKRLLHKVWHIHILLGLFFTLTVCIVLWWIPPHDTRVGPLAPAMPEQQILVNIPDFELLGYTLKPLASLHARMRVLSVAWYAEGAGADIAPVDLALGWGPMSDNAVLQYFEVRQSQRWYALSAPKSPISMYSAAQHSANMHIVPANTGLLTHLRSLQVGDVVEVTGWLVNVTGKSWHVATSLTRDDRGAGACEVVYLLSLQKS